MIKISVIIPVYNKEKMLSVCLESACGQSIREVEIICIDDGSTDGSTSILKEYAGRDNRIRIFRQENKGAGAARNCALSLARGKYIAFLDADDWYPRSDALEALYVAATKHGANICGGSILFSQNDIFVPSVVEDIDYTFSQEGWVPYESFQQDYYFQRFIYQREFLIKKGLTFKPYSQYEDTLFMVQAMMASEEIYVIPLNIYTYRVKEVFKDWDIDTEKHALSAIKEELDISARKGMGILHARILKHLSWYLDWIDRNCHGDEAKSLVPYLHSILTSVSCELLNQDFFSLSLDRIKSMIDVYDRKLCLIHDDSWNTKEEDFIPIMEGKNDNIATSTMHNSGGLTEKAGEPEHTPLVSVVVPVYNVAPYLADCLNSLLKQSLKDIEIICVNDGSTDESMFILEQFAQKNPTISIYSQDNQGLSCARNTGVVHAKGKYLYFMDSDDILSQAALFKLTFHAERDSLDVVFFDADVFSVDKDLSKAVSDEKKYLSRKGEYKGVFTGPDIVSRMVANNDYKTPVWLSMVSREFYVRNRLSFIPHILHEDNPYTFKASILAKRIAYIPEKLFQRRIRRNSIMTKPRSFENVRGYFYAYLDMAHTLEEVEKDIDKEGAFRKIMNGVLQSSRLIYMYLSLDEQEKYNTLPEKDLFRELYFYPRDRSSTEMVESNGFEGQKLEPLDQSIIEESSCHKDNEISNIPEVSVIVPVYNVDRYLTDCLESLIHQSLNNIEIICVNDGSTDRSLDIALLYAAKDKRISVYTQENEGLSSARNKGVSLARGRFLQFVDSDDMLVHNSLEKLVDTAEKCLADFIIFESDIICNNLSHCKRMSSLKTYYSHKYKYNGVYSGIDLFNEMIKNGEYREPVWQLFIRRDFYVKASLYFIEGIIFEDVPFSFRAFMFASRAFFLNEKLYIRRLREGSITDMPNNYENVKGYYYGYLEMELTMKDIELQPEQKKRVREYVGYIRERCIDIYESLSKEEQERYLELPPYQKHRFEQEIRKAPYPEYFFIELTRNCNLHCPMCRGDDIPEHDHGMKDDILRKALDIVIKYAKVVDLRLWGESTLDDRLLELAGFLHDKGIMTRLYTNLNARYADYYRQLARTGIMLAISLESGIAENYKRLRVGGSLERLESNLEAFVETCHREELVNIPYFSVVVSEHNMSDFCSIVELASKHGIHEIELNPISCFEKGKHRTGFRAADRDAAVKALSEMEIMSERCGITVTVAATLFSENSVPVHRCIHPWKYCVIGIDGRIRYCDHIGKKIRGIMGDLNENSFEDIWNSEQYRTVRRQHRKYDFTGLKKEGMDCGWCARNRYGNSEWLVEPGIEAIVLKDYLAGLEF